MELKIILASKSPRRKELMKMAGFTFSVQSKNVSEEHPQGLDAESIPAYLAEKKARAFWADLDDNTVVIGADTVVLLEGKIYEKPVDAADAIKMLSALSGKMHRVITGVCILSKNRKKVFSETTSVYFNDLTSAEIEYYVNEFKPFDKAGSYACQEWIGAIGIRKFDGDYFNVVGLPVNRVYKEMKEF
jgi:septum formation protein